MLLKPDLQCLVRWQSGQIQQVIISHTLGAHVKVELPDFSLKVFPPLHHFDILIAHSCVACHSVVLLFLHFAFIVGRWRYCVLWLWIRKLPSMCADFDVTPLCDIYTEGFLQQQQQQHNIYDESLQILQAQQQRGSPEPSTAILHLHFSKMMIPTSCSW